MLGMACESAGRSSALVVFMRCIAFVNRGRCPGGAGWLEACFWQVKLRWTTLSLYKKRGLRSGPSKVHLEIQGTCTTMCQGLTWKWSSPSFRRAAYILWYSVANRPWHRFGSCVRGACYAMPFVCRLLLPIGHGSI